MTGLTHALTVMDLRGEKRTSYPRGLGGGNRGGVGGWRENCQRLLPALMWGLERAEGAVRPS